MFSAASTAGHTAGNHYRTIDNPVEKWQVSPLGLQKPGLSHPELKEPLPQSKAIGGGGAYELPWVIQNNIDSHNYGFHLYF